MGFRGAIFDVDGVLVDSPHEQAWREGLQQLMDNEWRDVRDQTSYAPEKFTPEVYQKEMSGKPRYAGAQAVLEYFRVPPFLTFGALEKAQALGDGQALRENGRRFIRFHLGKDVVGGIGRLLEKLS
jgi:beta-phosphoglucomutase-like phosphatase (HAD superfamily)